MLSKNLMAAAGNSGTTAWDIANATFSGNSVAFDTTPTFSSAVPIASEFSPDGLNFYILEVGGQGMSWWTASTAFNLSTLTFKARMSVVDFGITVSDAISFAFKPDGTKLYIANSGTTNPYVYQIDLAVAWNITSSRAYVTYTYNRGGTVDLRDIRFRDDGTQFFMAYYLTTGNAIYTYTLSTAWDLSTATATTSNSIGTFTYFRGLDFNANGSIVYCLAGNTSQSLYQIPLSTPYLISSAGSTAASKDFGLYLHQNLLYAPRFNNSGANLMMTSNGKGNVWNIPLTTPYLFTSPVTVSTNCLNTAGQDPTVAYTLNSYATFMTSDGTKLFVTNSGNYVTKYNLSTAYDIATAVYSQQLDATTYTSNLPTGIFFNSTGTLLFLYSNTYGTVKKFTLSTAYDLSTVTLSQTYTPTAYIPAGVGWNLQFNSAGTKMYISSMDASLTDWFTKNFIQEFTLSTAWDLSTATTTVNSNPVLDLSTNVNYANGMTFGDSGAKMYVIDSTNSSTVGRYIRTYSLSTPYDVSTATYLNATSLGSQMAIGSQIVTGLQFSTSGTTMIVYVANSSGQGYTIAIKYALTTAWDPTTLVFSGKFPYIYLGTYEAAPTGVTFGNNGSSLYTIGSTGDYIRQYNLTTAYDISTASYYAGASVSTVDATAQALFFDPTGTRVFILGATQDRVTQHALATAWNITSFSTTVVASVSLTTLETSSTGMCFSTDGAYMYVVGTANDSVLQWYLSNPWDLSTAVYQASASLIAWCPALSGVQIKSDGTKLYCSDSTALTVTEFSLAGSYDISALKPTKSVVIAKNGNTPSDFCFNNTGTSMVVISSTGDQAIQVNLSTAYDLSTVSTKSTGYRGLAQNNLLQYQLPTFTPDGLTLYGMNANVWYKHTTPTAWDIDNLTGPTTKAYQLGSLAGGNSSYLSYSADGLLLICTNTQKNNLWTYTLSTAFDPTTIDTTSYKALTLAAASVTGGVCTMPTTGRLFVYSQVTLSLYRYLLSSPNDVSTAGSPTTYAINAATYGFDPGNTRVTWIFWGSSGTKMYIVYGGNSFKVAQYTLGTAYTPSTVTFVASLDISSQIPFSSDNASSALTIQSANFSTDGLHLYLFTYTGGIHHFTLSTAWNIATAVYSNGYTNVNLFTTTNSALYGQNVSGIMKGDGTTAMIGSMGYGKMVTQYTFSTAHNVSTITYTGTDYKLLNQHPETNCWGLKFGNNGLKAYLLGLRSNYTPSTTNFYTNLTVWLVEYTLTTAYDMTTATYTGKQFNTGVNSQAFSYGSTDFVGCQFDWNSTGTKFTLASCVTASQPINSSICATYTCSTAWDISTAACAGTDVLYIQPTSNPGYAFKIKPDGSRLFVANGTNNIANTSTAPSAVTQFNLSTAGDIGTARPSAVSGPLAFTNYDISGIEIDSTGKKMYLLSNNTANILKYDL